ncbi:hypothetical protein EVAR_100141_1 [Eumeta japonica]|uniref:Uncharacterized protein n=1 Tax=Eumeta variegata TaxID=151549 RepID=A0A4C1S9A5_EUMVA|nr:hypothetical protein EVAR_100141_1 [Eumeta japonica]
MCAVKRQYCSEYCSPVHNQVLGHRANRGHITRGTTAPSILRPRRNSRAYTQLLHAACSASIRFHLELRHSAARTEHHTSTVHTHIYAMI